MNFYNSTCKSFSLGADDLKEVINLVKNISEANENKFYPNSDPLITIKYFDGINKEHKNLETALQSKNTAKNPITSISVLSTPGQNKIDFYFTLGGLAYRLDCAEEEKFYYYKAQAEELISSFYEDRIYDSLFNSGTIFFLIFAFIQLLIGAILSKVIGVSSLYYNIFLYSNVAVYLLTVWLFMCRRKRLFPMAFFLIGHGIDRKNKNIKLRKALLTTIPVTVLGLILQIVSLLIN